MSLILISTGLGCILWALITRFFLRRVDPQARTILGRYNAIPFRKDLLAMIGFAGVGLAAAFAAAAMLRVLLP